MRSLKPFRAFTMIEMLSAIAIIGVLVAITVPIVGNYVKMARKTSDKQTLMVLNDAINRYKTQGGDISALLDDITYPDLMTLLTTPVEWNQMRHQFWRGSNKPIAKTLESTGSGVSYRITAFNTYDEGGGLPVAIDGNANYVAYGGGNITYYSIDGINWKQSTLGSGSYDMQALLFAGGKFVMVNRGGNEAFYSSNGVNWTEGTLHTSTWWSQLNYANGRFYAAPDHAVSGLSTSTDGINWTSTSIGVAASWRDVVYGNGVWVMRASSGNQIAYSSNGTTWSMATLPDSVNWGGLAFGDGVFVLGAADDSRVMISSDGANWAEASTTRGAGSIWGTILYNNGVFVALKWGDSLAYSNDGNNWTNVSGIPNENWGSLGSSGIWNNRFVAGSGNNLIYSEDGANWTNVLLPASGGQVPLVNLSGLTVSMRSSQTGNYSTDGDNWSTFNLPSVPSKMRVAARH